MVTDPLSAATIAELRLEHQVDAEGYCRECRYQYPCYMIEALDALAAAERELAELKGPNRMVIDTTHGSMTKPQNNNAAGIPVRLDAAITISGESHTRFDNDADIHWFPEASTTAPSSHPHWRTRTIGAATDGAENSND